MSDLKQQSAMEYLMTYGWAILIVAIVLVALFALNIFKAPPAPTACLAQPGFTCGSLVFNALAVNANDAPTLTAIVGTTAGPWNNVQIVIVPNGQVITDTSIGNEFSPNDFNYWGSAYGQAATLGTVQSGQTQQATIYLATVYPNLAFSQVKLGTQLTGTLWVMYQTPAGGSTYYLAEMGTVSVIATKNS